jgi:predicted NBD/HSP70 family sugar kinase
MLDRFLKLTVTLTLLLFLIQAVIGVFARALAALLATLVASVARTGSVVGGLVVALVGVCSVVGLAVRAVQLIANREPRVVRERAARDRVVRQRARRPAEGVPPVESHAEVLNDPDPAIGEEERH